MNPITVAQLSEIVNGQLSNTTAALTFEGVSIDSRSIEPGQAFFAISGDNFDGHDYALAAIEKGASKFSVSIPMLTKKISVMETQKSYIADKRYQKAKERFVQNQ